MFLIVDIKFLSLVLLLFLVVKRIWICVNFDEGDLLLYDKNIIFDDYFWMIVILLEIYFVNLIVVVFMMLFFIYRISCVILLFINILEKYFLLKLVRNFFFIIYEIFKKLKGVKLYM